MAVEYDKYYQTENLFGAPYSELIDFYSSLKTKGRLLDIGCGQGRDSIALAQLGFDVLGIDNSEIGIEQLNKVAKEKSLSLVGKTEDIYEFAHFDEFDFILLDSMFHFGKKERDKETEFLKKIITSSKLNTLITICIQNTGNKLKILNSIIHEMEGLKIVHQTDLVYKYEDKASKHSSETKYKMISIQTINHDQ